MSTSINTFIDNIKELEDLATRYIPTTTHPEYYNEKQLVLDFIRREIYNGGKWALATGTSINWGYVSYVESKSQYLVRFFGDEDSAGNNVKDSRGQKINGIHLCATLQAILFGALTSEWFGWGGDVATGARNIHTERNKAKNKGISESSMADKVIGNENYNCSFTDIVSDIDAVLIGDNYSNRKKLSDIFEEYYDRAYRYRFEDFVNFYGGKRKFKTKVKKVLDSKILCSQLAKGATDAEIEAACDKFIEIVFENM